MQPAELFDDQGLHARLIFLWHTLRHGLLNQG